MDQLLQEGWTKEYLEDTQDNRYTKKGKHGIYTVYQDVFTGASHAFYTRTSDGCKMDVDLSNPTARLLIIACAEFDGQDMPGDITQDLVKA